MSGGGGARGVEAAARKLIESLNEIVKRPLADITAALRESGMNPDKAVTLLLSQEEDNRANKEAPSSENKAGQSDHSLNDNEDEDSPSSNDDMSLRDSTPDELANEDVDTSDVSPESEAEKTPKMKKRGPRVKKAKGPPKKKAKLLVPSGQEAGNDEKQIVGKHTNSKSSNYRGTGQKKNLGRRKPGCRNWVCQQCDRTFQSAIAYEFHQKAKHPTD